MTNYIPRTVLICKCGHPCEWHNTYGGDTRAECSTRSCDCMFGPYPTGETGTPPPVVMTHTAAAQ